MISNPRLDALPVVHLDQGRCKFIYAKVHTGDEPGHRVYEFVRSKKGASLHHMVADELIDQLCEMGIPRERIEIPCGGRCAFKTDSIQIYGYSNQYGQGDNEHIARLVQAQFPEMKVTHSYEGY